MSDSSSPVAAFFAGSTARREAASRAALPLALALLAAVVALAVAPRELSDPAAFGFRAAERLATGAPAGPAAFGSPLGVLLLAALRFVGVAVPVAARLLGALTFAAIALLVQRLVRRLTFRAELAVLAALATILDRDLQRLVLSGDGSGLALALGLGALLAAIDGPVVASGLCLGGAIAAGLDGVPLAAALVAATVLLVGRVPSRVLLWSLPPLGALGAVVLLAFGGPGLADPLGAGAPEAGLLDPFRGVRWGVVAVAALRLLDFRDLAREQRFAVTALALWGLMLTATILLLDPPATHPWTGAPLLVVLWILAAARGGEVFARQLSWRRWEAWSAVLLVVPTLVAGLAGTVGAAADGAAPRDRIALSKELRAAGRFVAENARSGESVGSESGWFAFEAAVLRLAPGRSGGTPATYRASWADPGDPLSLPPVRPPSAESLAFFGPGGDGGWVRLSGVSGSAIAESGRRAFTLVDLVGASELPQWTVPGLRGLYGPDLFLHPPQELAFAIANEGREVDLRFTPAFRPEVAPTQSDGVTFDLAVDGVSLYRSLVRPDDSEREIEIRIPRAALLDSFELELSTEPGPARNSAYDRAVWRRATMTLGPFPNADEPAWTIEEPRQWPAGSSADGP